MSARVRAGRRRLVGALVLLLAIAVACVAVLVDHASNVRAQDAAGPVSVESQIGLASSATLLGPALGSGVPGEVWGLTNPNRTNPQPVTVDGQELAVPDTQRRGARYILRYRPDEGWRAVQAPQAADGTPYAGQLEAGRTTARGGLLLTGTAPSATLVRDAVGPTRVVAPPGPGVLRPGQGSTPDESLSTSVIAARALADGRTEGFAAIVGRAPQGAVAHWDGAAWNREPICVAEDGTTVPAGCDAGDTLLDAQFGLTAVSLAMVEGGDAWLLARAHVDAHRGLVLFRRTGTGADARWRLQPLPSRFSADTTPADGITDVAPADNPRAASATTDGVWIDGAFKLRGTDRTVTLHVTGGGTRSWCDGGVCDGELGFAIGAGQSQAFPGPGDGTRVVGPLSGGTRYATFDGTRWSVSASFAGIGDPTLAFSSLTEGWIGDIHITRDRPPSPTAAWSLPVRRPLNAVASAPGAPGDLGTSAVAVGLDGAIVRYTPGQGWDSEVRLGASGVAHDNLRGVAWPEANTAFAVGDEGAMWRWRRATGLWEGDPAAPVDFTGHLTGIAFQPGNPDRGFAVGRDGVLLQYGKSWEQMAVPPEALGADGAKPDLYGIAFAGGQALAAAGAAGVLVEDGGGWRIDAGAKALLDRVGTAARIMAVAGLPDGGAVAAGSVGDNQGVVLERDGPASPWRFSDQPLTGQAVAVGAFREGSRVRAVASVTQTTWPTNEDLILPAFDPNQPTPRRSAFSLPVDGYVMRETAAGWRDEERTKIGSPTNERSRKSDPNRAFLVDAAGRGWAVGGASGATDALQRGENVDSPPTVEAQTASVSRYDPAGPAPSSNVSVQAPSMPAGRARLLVGGHAQCSAACADLSPLDTMPDRTLTRAAGTSNLLAGVPGGPRAFVYTGGRVAPGSGPAPAAEEQRYAQLFGGNLLPVYAAAAPGDATQGTSGAFESAFAAFPAPFGQAPAAVGTTPVAIGAAPAPGRARTHYAVDITTPDGPVRLVVIDNASGSLGRRDTTGNPVEDQAAWLTAVLADARAKGIAVVASGNRSLNAREDGAATDATATATILQQGGASAYVYDGLGQQRRTAVPFGATATIPSFASGTLGYRNVDPDGRGIPGLLLLELDLAHRDRASNRAPAGVRLVPVLEDLAIEAVDGRLLNRSQPALFQGLGRRPRSGGNWPGGGSEGTGADPYVTLPSPICPVVSRAACAETRIDPEATFRSSDPDIANFVRLDPASTNPRKPFVDPKTDKPVADSASGLLCPFNAGTTTISIESGGLRYQTTITVRAGSVLRPCGTVPLDPSRFPKPKEPSTTPPPPPPPAPPPGTSNPDVHIPVPSIPAVVGPAPPVTPVTPSPVPPPTPRPPAPAPTPPALPAFIAPVVPGPLAVPPPPAAASPAPPPGTSGASINVPVSQPVSQAERQRDEEVAEESSQAYAQYEPLASTNNGSGPGDTAAIVGAVLLAAIGGGTAYGNRRRHRTPYAYARDPRSRTRRPR